MKVTQGGAGSVAATNERLLRVNPLRRLLIRPETGAVAGSIAVWIFFAIVAGSSGFLSLKGASNYLSVAAELAIQAVPVALLMIGGEFDLSVGSTVGVCSLIVVILSGPAGSGSPKEASSFQVVAMEKEAQASFMHEKRF